MIIGAAENRSDDGDDGKTGSRHGRCAQRDHCGGPSTVGRSGKEGIRTLQCDLLDRKSVGQLPRVQNIVFMAGRKFVPAAMMAHLGD